MQLYLLHSSLRSATQRTLPCVLHFVYKIRFNVQVHLSISCTKICSSLFKLTISQRNLLVLLSNPMPKDLPLSVILRSNPMPKDHPLSSILRPSPMPKDLPLSGILRPSPMPKDFSLSVILRSTPMPKDLPLSIILRSNPMPKDLPLSGILRPSPMPKDLPLSVILRSNPMPKDLPLSVILGPSPMTKELPLSVILRSNPMPKDFPLSVILGPNPMPKELPLSVILRPNPMPKNLPLSDICHVYCRSLAWQISKNVSCRQRHFLQSKDRHVGSRNAPKFHHSFYTQEHYFILLLCHCLLLHVAKVRLAYPVRRSQQQFDTYEEDPYWKTRVHFHATELMGVKIHKAACFFRQESCHMLGITC